MDSFTVEIRDLQGNVEQDGVITARNAVEAASRLYRAAHRDAVLSFAQQFQLEDTYHMQWWDTWGQNQWSLGAKRVVRATKTDPHPQLTEPLTHTPFPWHVHPIAGVEWGFSGPLRLQIRGPQDQIVVESATTPDARLIQQAPILLAHLQALLAFVDEGAPLTKYDEIWEQVRFALSLATE